MLFYHIRRDDEAEILLYSSLTSYSIFHDLHYIYRTREYLLVLAPTNS